MSAAAFRLRAMRYAHAVALAAMALPASACGTPSVAGEASVTVGGGFWSPRLRAVEHALKRCDPAPAPSQELPTERALFDALAMLSLDGASLRPDMPATCSASCARPEWTGRDPRGCASLAALASIGRAIWRVDGGESPAVTAALIADSDLAFTAAGIRWRIEQSTDYPWSSHLGIALSHRGPHDETGAGPAPDPPAGATGAQGTSSGAGAQRPAGEDPPSSGQGHVAPMPVERALDVRVQLPEWLDPSSVRISARGRMLTPADYSIDARMLTVRGPWADGDRMHVSFPMPPRRVATDGGVEIWRGPLRYVAESLDQPGGSLADTTVAPGDGLREVPYMLGALSAADAPVRQGDPMTQRPTPEPDAVANAAPNGIMAVMVERRARGLPDLVLVPLAFAGNRGDMPRTGTFAVPAP